MQYMLMWLEGPFQAWGDSSKYGPRDTLPFPTKSGIYGMILAAMGAKGTQEVLLEKLAECSQSIISFSKPSILRDFHMVGSGYDDQDGWQRLCIPKKQDGSTAVGGGSKMTYRYYLQEARFAVIQALHDELVDQMVQALQFPVYSPSLGRKSCVPSEFVYQGLYRLKEEAVIAALALGKQKGLQNMFMVTEDQTEDGDSRIIPDVPVRFGSQKEYRERIVHVTYYE